MNDMLEKAGTRATHAMNIVSAGGLVCAAAAAVWGVVAGFFTLPSEVQKLREDAKALREIVVLQQAKIDTGLRGPQGERGPVGPQGMQGLAGERGPAGPKGDTSTVVETNRSLTSAQITNLIDSRIAAAGNISATAQNGIQTGASPIVSGLKRESDGCHLLPPRQLSIAVRISSGFRFCNENRSVVADFFAIDPANKRVHLQIGQKQYDCSVGSKCSLSQVSREYEYRIDSFEQNGPVARLVFFRP